ncbi:hypothetical protein BDK51DRAFT_34320, partial [Blyttiomyces helicus]
PITEANSPYQSFRSLSSRLNIGDQQTRAESDLFSREAALMAFREAAAASGLMNTLDTPRVFRGLLGGGSSMSLGSAVLMEKSELARSLSPQDPNLHDTDEYTVALSQFGSIDRRRKEKTDVPRALAAFSQDPTIPDTNKYAFALSRFGSLSYLRSKKDTPSDAQVTLNSPNKPPSSLAGSSIADPLPKDTSRGGDGGGGDAPAIHVKTTLPSLGSCRDDGLIPRVRSADFAMGEVAPSQSARPVDTLTRTESDFRGNEVALMAFREAAAAKGILDPSEPPRVFRGLLGCGSSTSLGASLDKPSEHTSRGGGGGGGDGRPPVDTTTLPTLAANRQDDLPRLQAPLPLLLPKITTNSDTSIPAPHERESPEQDPAPASDSSLLSMSTRSHDLKSHSKSADWPGHSVSSDMCRDISATLVRCSSATDEPSPAGTFSPPDDRTALNELFGPRPVTASQGVPGPFHAGTLLPITERRASKDLPNPAPKPILTPASKKSKWSLLKASIKKLFQTASPSKDAIEYTAANLTECPPFHVG